MSTGACGGATSVPSPAPAATGAASTKRAAPAPPAPPDDPRQAACEGEALGTPEPLAPPLPVEGKVVEVALEGVTRLDEAALRRAIHAQPGPLDPAVIAADIRRLFAEEAIADVVVVAIPTHDYRDDRRLVYRITERPLVGEIFVDGEERVAREVARRIEAQSLVEPRRLHAWTRKVIDELHGRGHRDAALRVTLHAVAPGKVDLCVHAEPGPKTTVARWQITGVRSLPSAVVDAIYAEAGIGEDGAVLVDEALELARLKLQAAYYDHGHLESSVGKPVITPAGDDRIEVAIAVVEGPVYRYGDVTVDGHAKAAYPRIVAPLKKGAVFNRSAVKGVVEALEDYHRQEKLVVEVSTKLDDASHTVDLALRVASPGALPTPADAP